MTVKQYEKNTKQYDIDFARMEKMSKEPYIYYFDLFIELIVPYLKEIEAPVTLDADEYQQNRLRTLLLQIVNETQRRFNLGALEQNAKDVNTNIQRKSQASFTKALEKNIKVSADPENYESAAQQSKNIVSALSLGFSRQLQEINDRNSKTTATDLFLGQEQNLATTVLNRVMSGVSSGERWESIAASVLGSSEVKSGLKAIDDYDESMARKVSNKAKFIARNATSTIIGEYDKKQQQSAGVQLYMWQTAEDERVRPTHEALNGKVYSYDPRTKAPDSIQYGKSSYRKGQIVPQAKDPTYNSGAPTYPGQPWNCRCVAIALIPGIDYEI